MTTKGNHPKSLLENLDEFPPFLVYALAREGVGQTRAGKVRSIPLKRIIARFDFSERTFERTSARITWAKVNIDIALSFCRACNFNWAHTRRHRSFIRKMANGSGPLFAYLSKQHRTGFLRTCKRWEEFKASR